MENPENSYYRFFLEIKKTQEQKEEMLKKLQKIDDDILVLNVQKSFSNFWNKTLEIIYQGISYVTIPISILLIVKPILFYEVLVKMNVYKRPLSEITGAEQDMVKFIAYLAIFIAVLLFLRRNHLREMRVLNNELKERNRVFKEIVSDYKSCLQSELKKIHKVESLEGKTAEGTEEKESTE